MKERPILFSGPMVRALLAGTKTQTRRAMRPQPSHMNPAGIPRLAHLVGPSSVISCPYGQPGDQLWVRETYFAFGRWETRFSVEKGRDEWHFIDMTIECGHAYAFEPPAGWKKPRRGDGVLPQWWRRPAIFMPRAASRITLEITEVRVERLQAISEADAIAEGIEQVPGPESYPMWRDYGKPNTRVLPASASYETLWQSINGPDSWDANPWVWVVEFKRVTP